MKKLLIIISSFIAVLAAPANAYAVSFELISAEPYILQFRINCDNPSSNQIAGFRNIDEVLDAGGGCGSSTAVNPYLDGIEANGYGNYTFFEFDERQCVPDELTLSEFAVLPCVYENAITSFSSYYN